MRTPSTMYVELFDRCKRTLEAGWKGGYTVPHTLLYPFQWNWDAGFVSLGYSCYDMQKAYSELRFLFKGQWENGFLPHVIYHDRSVSTYYPDAEFYQGKVSPHYPKGSIFTSGLTQPPVHGFILKALYDRASDKKEAKAFLAEMFPKVLSYHHYLYDNRDFSGDGLVYIVHNWESGTDNSPAWDDLWKFIDKKVPPYQIERRDTKIVNAEQRPTQREYDYYLYLIDSLISLNYEDTEIKKKHEFLVEDPLFNTMLIRSNDALAECADLIGESHQIEKLTAWSERTKRTLNKKLYDKHDKVYKYYDLIEDKVIDVITLSGMSPLFANVPTQDQAQEMLSCLLGPIFHGKENEFYSFPSFNTQDSRFDSCRYWRGPVWIQMNWVILHGLENYGFVEEAKKVFRDTLSLVKDQGLWEYYEPNKEKSASERRGYGGENFSSWTPSLLIDLLKKYGYV